MLNIEVILFKIKSINSLLRKKYNKSLETNSEAISVSNLTIKNYILQFDKIRECFKVICKQII